MKEKSWGCTLITQLSLCVAAYIALSSIRQPKNGGDIYFISVVGGFRPLQHQTILLQQISMAAKTYKAQFVVDISEFGDSDPLLQNATTFPGLQTIPWYATGLGQGKSYIKKLKFPYDDKTIDILALDTVSFQDPLSASEDDQLRWLRRALKDSDADWRIGIGFHQLHTRDCIDWTADERAFFDSLHKMLQQNNMNAYLSSNVCAGHVRRGERKLYNAVPGDEHRPYITPLDQNHVFRQEVSDGFLLHRIGSSSGMVSYVVKLTVEVKELLSLGRQSKAAV